MATIGQHRVCRDYIFLFADCSRFCIASTMTQPPSVSLPDISALAVELRGAALVSADGEIEALSLPQAAVRAMQEPLLICHEPAVRARLGTDPLSHAFDVLDLFAFVRPAVFCLPTPAGVARALGLPEPDDEEDAAGVLHQAAALLLKDLSRPTYPHRPQVQRLAQTMTKARWPWGPFVIEAVGRPTSGNDAATGLDVWRDLPEWEDEAPRPPPDDLPVGAADVQDRLTALLGAGAEERPSQRDYADHVANAFQPRAVATAPNAVLADAGTGTGKTLGYIAPASLWAERNGGAVWLSTFTKNLQRQLDQELDRRYPDKGEKARRVVVRKGRENYLCLLNFEEAVARARIAPENVVRLALIARWVQHTRDGDMVGGDLPAWLMQRVGMGRASGLTDRRGECIYSSCPHWRTCFIEHSARKAKGADLVIANHALVMIRAAMYGTEEDHPTRYVFDEGHHLFDAADSAFAAHLSGHETAELRRWIRGPEGNRSSGRSRGLENRIGDLLEGHEDSHTLARAAIRAAAALPGEGWLGRISGNNAQGPAEAFLLHARQHVYARATRPDDPYTLEAGTTKPHEALLQAARALQGALTEVITPLEQLARVLNRRLVDEADDLDTTARTRLDAARNGLMRRVEHGLKPWRAMLRALEGEREPAFVDWFSVEKSGGREVDVGLHRHWIDPTRPFADVVMAPAHGVVVTSATLRDETESDADPAGESGWQDAELRTGFNHLVLPGHRASHASPFDYGAATKVLIVNDLNRNAVDQVAGAYAALFRAAGGGGLGLFTAIARLRRVYDQIAGPLAEAGLPLYAQHVDAYDAGTLVDIFRAELHSCLLGTDAVRDGVDVPGAALRLIVFDRVPWPRPSILHRARRTAFGDRRYDDMLTRLRLKQAFGRLIRQDGDRGVFVMLDGATPTRLLGAFPQTVEVERLGLKDAIETVGAFLDGPA